MTVSPIVAIGGCSGSGKTTLARAVARRLDALILPLDAYYRDLSHLAPADRDRTNFDTPEAIEHGLLERDLARLAAGTPIRRPVYDFETHTRTARTEFVPASQPLILEGIFALYWKPVRRMCTLKVFVDLDHTSCLTRRLERDTTTRGRSAESVRRQYAATVLPMAERHVIPTRRLADLIVSGAAPVEDTALQTLRALRIRTGPCH